MTFYPQRYRPAISLITCLLLAGCSGEHSQDAERSTVSAPPEINAEELQAEIKAFCGACHGLPRPSSFAKHAWEEEVEQGYRLYFESGRTDLNPPRRQRLVVEYFRDRAPEELQIELPKRSTAVVPIEFTKQNFELSPEGAPITVSHLRSVPKASAHGAGLLLCDMKNGHLIWADPLEPNTSGVVLDQFQNPAHVEQTDLNGDGEPDYVVADLGSFLPDDHEKGKVYWLWRDTANGVWEKATLLANVSRVASVEAGDFDGDSRIDLVVAEFGWRRTGSVQLLRNVSENTGEPKFEAETIDDRAGAIHVQQCDLNSDGQLDFVTILSQEHETIVAFINEGKGSFRTETVWSAGYPSYGSSGIELVDLDGDGDLDVLYTNGDSFDDFHIKPYHSVQWLENQGSYPFTHHHITAMPGVHRALAGDLDGDDDLDIVAVALLPEQVRGQPICEKLDSVILLEQVDGEFVRHPLETARANHASFEMADFDRDQDLDLAVGVWGEESSKSRLTIWWNQHND